MRSIPNTPNLKSFLGSSSKWDYPFYKKLTKTDLGRKGADGRKSKQSGPLINSRFKDYMPQFPESDLKSASFSIDLNLELWVGNVFWGQLNSKFRCETRGLKRSPEYRITTNIKDWLSEAEIGDWLIVQKNLANDQFLRLVILPNDTIETGNRNAHDLKNYNPITPEGLQAAKDQRQQLQNYPFRAKTYNNKVTITTTSNARSKDFAMAVNNQYNYKCALCGEGLCSPAGSNTEVEAAHIIPVASNGPDDVRNGLTLCRKHHWAFDRGMWGLTDALTVTVPASVQAIPQNDSLTAFDGKKIYQPKDTSLQPHIDAIRWHRDNILLDD